MATFRCSSCGRSKAASSFHRSRDRKRGYRSNCKACVRLMQSRTVSRFDPCAAFECRVCHVRKPGREFYRDRTKPHGHTYQCKSCKNRYFTTYTKARKRRDPAFAQKCRLFDALRVFVRRDTRAGGLWRYLGCNWCTFRCHLESNFSPGMSFSNYGSAWHVDHIAPCRMFGASELHLCWWYKNLRPMWKRSNWLKRDKMVVCREVVLETYENWLLTVV